MQKDLYFPVEIAVWLSDANHYMSEGFIDIDLTKCCVLLPPLLFSQLVDLMLGLILKYLTSNRLRGTVNRSHPLCVTFCHLTLTR